ncbi:hypothetical protein SAMN05216558_1350 [Pseudomonas vancouverensis]|nr:hypothetical protein SAMN05216558_1350 [Pseudomonas vancouverensis]
MMILVDPRCRLAVQASDISSMQLVLKPGGSCSLVLHMTSGREIDIPSWNDSGFLDLSAVHAKIMGAGK